MKKPLQFMVKVALCAVSFSGAGQSFRSILYNPPSTDNGYEYIELIGTPNTPLTGVTILYLDGDGITAAGTIKTVYNIPTTTFGSNGLLLLRDASQVLSPAPSSETTVIVQDFSPDIQNGSGTFLLVTGFSGAYNQDLDTDNNGTLDILPWATVLSAVSVRDIATNTADKLYATSLGGVNIEKPASPATTPAGIAFMSGVWNAFTLTGGSTNPGPYIVNNAWTFAPVANSSLQGLQLTPGNTFAALPVRYVSFSVKQDHSAVSLQWVTVNEQQNSGFEVQRSHNAVDFVSLGFVAGKGDFLEKTNYFFTDELPLYGANYYRLKQKSDDGSFEYSRIVSIVDVEDRVVEVVLSPNPVLDNIRLDVVDGVEVRQIFLLNQEGMHIATYNENTIEKSLWVLPAGTYFFRIEIADNRFVTQKVVKL